MLRQYLKIILLITLPLILPPVYAKSAVFLANINPNQLLADIETLSSDQMAGRKPNTPGHLLAQEYILNTFKNEKLHKFGDYRQQFTFGFNDNEGVNLLAYIPGKTTSTKFIVFTAHYDHLGKKGTKIFNGADDNASGVAAMLFLARYFNKNKPHYSMIFLATDAEEKGLLGAKYFINNPTVKLSNILLNINLDMISQGGSRNKLFVAGTRRNTQLLAIVNNIQEQVKTPRFRLVKGHDRRSNYHSKYRVNWTKSSDHSPFLRKKIPYLFFGVDPHRHYHTQHDTYDNIESDFYIDAVNTILITMIEIDKYYR